MSDNGWICLHRSILDWEWWDDHNTTRLFIYCLIKANYEDKKWKGIDIKKGSFITGINNLAHELGLSVMQTRTSIKKLKSTGEITIKTTNKYSVISITYYEKYQQVNKQDNKRITNEQQTNNKQITTDNNITNKQINNGTSLKPSPAKAGQSKSKFSDDDFSLAENFYKSLLRENPNHKKPNLKSWANDIRLMRERDKRTHQEIAQVWYWARADNFWSSNIMSPSKLRDKFDQLKIKSQRGPANDNRRLSAVERVMQNVANEERAERGEPEQTSDSQTMDCTFWVVRE